MCRRMDSHSFAPCGLSLEVLLIQQGLCETKVCPSPWVLGCSDGFTHAYFAHRPAARAAAHEDACPIGQIFTTSRFPQCAVRFCALVRRGTRCGHCHLSIDFRYAIGWAE